MFSGDPDYRFSEGIIALTQRLVSLFTLRHKFFADNPRIEQLVTVIGTDHQLRNAARTGGAKDKIRLARKIGIESGKEPRFFWALPYFEVILQWVG
jgi:hypothetical protein